MSSNVARSIYLSIFVSTALAAPHWANSTRRDGPTTNVDSSLFEADSSIDVSGLYDYVKSNKGDDVMGTYGTCNDCDYGKDVNIYDQSSLVTGLFTFMADMDVDCDGVNYQCPGNTDGQDQTNFGEADTYQVPWYVIPDNFVSPHKVKDNALGAVICDGKMYYAIFADSNGDTPQVLGEGSWLLAKSCFPDGNISGANGHTQADVAYIVFSQDTPDGVNSKTLEYGPLKTLGDQRVKQLMSKLNLSGSGGSSTGAGSSSTETASSEPTSTDSSEPSMTATMWDPIATSTVDTTAAPTSTSCKTKKNKKKGSKKSSKRSEETKKSVKRTYRRSAKA